MPASFPKLGSGSGLMIERLDYALNSGFRGSKLGSNDILRHVQISIYNRVSQERTDRKASDGQSRNQTFAS